MTFNTAQKSAISLTEQEMKPLWSAVLKSYSTAQKEIQAELAKVYAKYLSTADPDDYYNIMIKYDRLTTLQKQVIAAYNTAAKSAGVAMVKSSELAITNTFYREQYSLSWFSPSVDVGLTFSALDKRVVQSSVFSTAKLWQAIQTDALTARYGNPKLYISQAGSLSDLLAKNRLADVEKIRNTITTGLIQGKSYSKMIDGIKDVTGREIVKNGKRAYTGAKANASRIIRTEGTRNLNAGTIASLEDAQSQGVGSKKQWVATLDLKTRGSHSSADGKTADADGNFHVNGAVGQAPGQLSISGENINCRCTTIGVIEGLEPTLRRGRNPVTGENEVFDYKDFDTWSKENGLTRDKSGVLKVS